MLSARSSRLLLGLIVAAAWCFSGSIRIAHAQTGPINGMRPSDIRAHAITNATVITQPGQKIEKATIIIRNGVIEALGVDVKIPAGAREWPGDGLTVYPGLIDAALLIKPAEESRGGNAYWNARVHPEINMADQPGPDKALRKDLRSIGFTAAAVYPSAGAWRGTGVVIALADEDEYTLVYKQKAAMAAGFDYGGGRRGIVEGPEGGSNYPGSLMGAIALLRQSALDAQWHAECRRIWNEHPLGNEPPARSDALAALNDVLKTDQRQQVLFEVSDEQNALRAVRFAKEFNLDLILLGSGYEFRQLNEIAQTKTPIILPLEFPKRPEVSTQTAADSVSLRDLMTWEQAPTNPRRLMKAGMTVALTTNGMKSRTEFPANLRTAIKCGLTEDEALAALTTTPAKMLGLQSVIGTIEQGKAANLVVVKGSLFDKDSKIRDTWVNGRRYEISKDKDAAVQLKGTGVLKIQGVNSREIPIDVDTAKSSVSLHLPDKKKSSAKKVTVSGDQISFVSDGRPFGAEGYVRLAGVIEKNTITGNGTMPNGETFGFVIEITPKAAGDEGKPDSKPDEAAETPENKPDGEGEAEAPNDPAPRGGARRSDPVTGTWSISLEDMPEGMSITYTLKLQGKSVSGTVNMMGRDREISGGEFDPSTGKMTYSTSGPGGTTSSAEATINGDSMTGTITSPRGVRNFTGQREGAGGSGSNRGRQGAGRGGGADREAKFVMPPEQLDFPLGEYGMVEPPKAENFVINNATIWTCGPQGIIHGGWMLIKDGKIAQLGSGAAPQDPSLKTEDLRGKNITPGIIDCHSHTGIDGGVNEFSQANTAECRIADCIDPDDIDWYRELAGGLTACNQLHGSANPIGGQNSVVKIKWGAAGGADAFPIKGAMPGIKFALGENVKRSSGRYPNTRMGVETFDRDAFTAAQEYKARWDRYNALSADQKRITMPPRRDLELDALVEILEHKRIIHCHSYRQDEILMLIRLADSFGFTVGTFQHVLEGYKIADAIAKHGAGGSTFSDWWAYKVEVMDAVPYNGALMHDVGVLVSFNSDSDELARRLSYEAAKAVRYGGLSPEEALKFVTINPAKQLRIDQWTGSLEKGKDADFVVWSEDPMSSYSRCEQTWIDGACYFSLEMDAQLRQTIQRERQRIIQRILMQVHGEIEKPKDLPSSQPATAPATQPGER